MRKFRLMLSAAIMLLAVVAFIKSPTQLSAAADANTGVIVSAEVPAWAKGKESFIQQQFVDAYESSGLTKPSVGTVKVISLDKARHGLYQTFGDSEAALEGAIFFNEVEGKPIVVKDLAVIAKLNELNTITPGVLLAVTEVSGEKYIVSDLAVVKVSDSSNHTFNVGVGTTLDAFMGAGASFTAEAVKNDFAKAYKWSENFVASLGLPTSEVAMANYNPLAFTAESGEIAEPRVNVAKKLYKQSFENGYIMMGSHAGRPQYGAAPITKAMYDLVVALTGNADFSLTGAPTSIQYDFEGVLYQNFEYGLVKVEAGVATFSEQLAVDSVGTIMNFRVGAPREFINYHWGTTNRDVYMTGWERIRITENIRDVVGQMIRDDRAPYKTSVDDPFGNTRIHALTFRADDVGVWHIMKDGTGQNIGWGNVFITQGYWYNDAFEIAPEFNQPALGERVALGRPSDIRRTLYNATYQLFEKGIVYTSNLRDVNNNLIKEFKAGAEFTTWLNGETVEQALVTHGIANANHTVTFIDWDDTVLGTVSVPHGTAATAPVTPTRAEYDFNGWDGDITNVTNALTVRATYVIARGVPEVGTYKFINFDVAENSGNFWYENEDNKISITDAHLYNAFRSGKDNMAEAIEVSGFPIFADSVNLITTKYHFQIDSLDPTKINVLPKTIGQLGDDVTSLKNVTSNIALDATKKLIIQDSFGDAFVFARDRGGHDLGLPVGDAVIVRLYPNPSITTEWIDVIVQEFEHGKIMQEVYDNAAYPIYGDMLTIWERANAEGAPGGDGFEGLGTPTSREFTHEGSTYQNFKYGYMKVTEEVVEITYSESVQLDFKGREIDKRAGRTESRSNIAKGNHVDFEHEVLRVYEAYMNYFTAKVDEGFMFNHAIEWVHEWNGNGLTQGYNPSKSTASVWGQSNFTVVLMQTPYSPVVLVKDEMLQQYALLNGNITFGFPVADSFKVNVDVTYEGQAKTLEVTYQNFTAGYIRSYITGDVIVYEYFRDAQITEDNKHMVEGVEQALPEWNLDGFEELPTIDKAELQAKLTQLKTERAKVVELVGDIKDKPSTQLYASKALLAEVDAKIAAVEAMLLREDLTAEEITTELVALDATITKLKNQSQAGQKTTTGETPSENEGLSTGAVVGIVSGSVVTLAVVIFLVFKFVLKKKF
ncbi:InlB B-repeat-containing protein [Acholeplasma vituli]|uniref:InlB B-repeat-containing protein n=1 Tax=Paracholeplasma vituli TaxID=69473 RepID=A0ABT2PUV7_9MOLU|nr:InlB B-repeat-containing protein [Paracholeplasma vituli]MCU0104119.1 InlB B-repeat-containing protein [Paracholeplasma vituli]